MSFYTNGFMGNAWGSNGRLLEKLSEFLDFNLTHYCQVFPFYTTWKQKT